MENKPFALSAKVVILDGHGRCLLLRRSPSSKGNPGMWDLPGGKVGDGEKFDQALLREVGEETGLDISLEHVVGASEYELAARKVAYIVLEATLRGNNQTVRLNPEHDDYAWVKCSEMCSMNLCRQYRSIALRYRSVS
ncbi:NUDIX domain-containing protein [Candidatus Sumerlaeota bacterium]|nr:NUDIX domain-containing protein [Candidatus Sumerlaeota bacterium]